MLNITLICSVHKNHGKCNSDALFDILERINPDVIFEEISFPLFTEKYKKQGNEILEIQAIKKYIKRKKVDLVDVDASELVTEQDKYNSKITESLYFCSSSFRSLIERQFEIECVKGFEFLNSTENDRFINEIKDIYEGTNDANIISNKNAWEEINDKRENGMIANIYEYCAKNIFRQSVFLVGSGHRYSIIKKIEKQTTESSIPVKWLFFNMPSHI